MSSTTLRLPEKTKAEQVRSKESWNAEHGTPEPDFYTIGYSGRDIHDFIRVLKRAGIATLVDIRYSPVSRFKPIFSKKNLRATLEANGVRYIHRPDWGVPRDIRALSIGRETRDDIWAWYDSHVTPLVARRNLDEFLNSMEHPVALMCVEYDPTECHRHRLFLGLERLGLTGRDL